MIIKGEVVQIIFENNENNYKIFVVENEKERLTLCGYLKDLTDSVIYEFEVEEVNHPKYGRQYKVLNYKIVVENDREGIVNYLSSSLFPHVGIISAENIFDTLGPNCLDLIKKDYTILNQVPHLTNNQKVTIYTNLISNQILEETFVHLYQIGLSNQMALKLYDKYHEETLNIINENPYRLIYDLEGFGFKKADELARKLGFSYDNPERLQALLVFTLNNLTQNYGLTYLLEDQLLNAAYQFGLNGSNMGLEILIESLKKTVKLGFIDKENDRYYVPSIRYCEKNVSQKIEALLNMKPVSKKIDMMDSLIKDFEKMNSIEFSSSQKLAISNAINQRVSIITGGPGTGKTTIIKAIIQIYAALKGFSLYDDEAFSKILLAAPTGKAAKKLREATLFKASTIHKALGYNVEGEFAFNKENELPHRLIILDECSMIDTVLMSHIVDAIGMDTQLILVGDIDQLPSIGPGAILKDLIESERINTTYLKDIFRQEEGSNIVKLSQMVREGNVDLNIFDNIYEDLKYIRCKEVDGVSVILNIVSKHLEKGDDLYNDIEILAPMYKGQCGIDEINQSISNTFNKNYSFEFSQMGRTYKENDKIIQLTNSSELGILNGDMGIIDNKIYMPEDDDNKVMYDCDFDGNYVKLSQKDFDNCNLGYCMSIHKSQGSEYPIVILPIFRSYSIMLKRKLLYTAITRAKTKLYLVGDINAFSLGIKEIEANRQTSLALRLSTKEKQKINKIKIDDPDIPFEYLGEEDMENITPYSFMEN